MYLFVAERKGNRATTVDSIAVKKHHKKDPSPVRLPSAAPAFEDVSDGKYMMADGAFCSPLVVVGIVGGDITLEHKLEESNRRKVT